MTEEKRQQALYILRKRGDPFLTALYFDRPDPAIAPAASGSPVPARKAAAPEKLPGAVRIPAGAAVYYGCLPGTACTEEQAAGWAAASPLRDGFRTITAETLPAFRNRGVASACLSCLLRSESGPFLYLVRRDNLPSLRLAFSCGFLPVPGAGGEIPVSLAKNPNIV
ncbi:MAG: GNAT family N-acetyltransferase [Clostridia bacterium]|nr:GNAT family N-acetyltransferase [Clostridia bacterium]